VNPRRPRPLHVAMKLLGDLKSPRLIHAKGGLFAVLGLLSGGLLLAQAPTLAVAALLLVTVWAWCRFYYYLFHVLEHYLGRGQRFAGVIDALKFLTARRRRGKAGRHVPEDHG